MLLAHTTITSPIHVYRITWELGFKRALMSISDFTLNIYKYKQQLTRRTMSFNNSANTTH